MAAKAFRADLKNLIKLCGASQKLIAEKVLITSQAQMSRQINSDQTEWHFYEKIIKFCLARIDSDRLPDGMPQEWASISHWEDQFEAARRPRRSTETPTASPHGQDDGTAAPASAASRSRRPGLIAATAVVGVAAVLVGSYLLVGRDAETLGAAGAAPNASSSTAGVLAADEPRVEVSGTCVGSDTQWQVKSSGFTPNGLYTVSVTYPDGTPYSLAGEGDRGNQGVANKDGSLNTRWACYPPDPEGWYTMTVVDESTGRSAKTKFYVNKAD